MMPGPITYILPDLPWDILLDGILHDAPVGSVLEVHTEAMYALVEQRLAESVRTDLVLHLKLKSDAPKGQAT